MTVWDRFMVSCLLAIGMALSPLIYAQNAARMLACASTMATHSMAELPDSPESACMIGAGSCRAAEIPDKSDSDEQSPSCDMSLCCAAARAPALFYAVSIPAQPELARLTLPDSDLLLNSRSLRPDPPPPRV